MVSITMLMLSMHGEVKNLFWTMDWNSFLEILTIALFFSERLNLYSIQNWNLSPPQYLTLFGPLTLLGINKAKSFSEEIRGLFLTLGFSKWIQNGYFRQYLFFALLQNTLSFIHVYLLFYFHEFKVLDQNTFKVEVFSFGYLIITF